MVSKELRNVLLNNSEKMKVAGELAGEWDLTKHRRDLAHPYCFHTGGPVPSVSSLFSPWTVFLALPAWWLCFLTVLS